MFIINLSQCFHWSLKTNYPGKFLTLILRSPIVNLVLSEHFFND